jgi:RNA polymerase sigma-70 factor (ECF subfamily)
MSSPDPLLVALAQQGDLPALDVLLRGVQQPLLRYVTGLLGRHRDLAEDVLQETMLRMVRKLRWLEEARFFRAWAFRIASRECFRALGRRRELTPLDEVDDGPLAVDPPVLDLFEQERVREAVASLSAPCRAVVSLHYFADFSLGEVADVLGVPLGTVKSRLAYGLDRLRRAEVLREER